MKKPPDSSADGQDHSLIEGATRRDLLWATAKLVASIAAALLAAVCLDGLLSKF